MRLRQLQSFSPFEFRSDFTARAEPETTHVPVSAQELAALLAKARAEGVAAANADHDSQLETQIQATVSQLNLALADLVALAGHLEASHQDPAVSEQARALINLTAQHIIDGQGDLFRMDDMPVHDCETIQSETRCPSSGAQDDDPR